MQFPLLILSVFILLRPDAWASDNELRPLSDVLQDEQSDVMATYAMQRCSALFIVVAGRSLNNPNSTDDLLKTYHDAANDFIATAALLLSTQRNLSAEEAVKLATATTEKIAKIYNESMEEHYLRTGNSFGENARGDITTCAQLHKGLS